MNHGRPSRRTLAWLTWVLLFSASILIIIGGWLALQVLSAAAG